jgi:hypothetical protein
MKTIINVQKPDGTSFDEVYTSNTPMLVIGNLFIGERYAEPQGPLRIVNENTGDVAEVEFKPRGTWSTKEQDKQFISGTVKNKQGQLKYTIQGRYSQKLEATEVETGKTFTTWEVPKFPEGP